MTEAKGTKKAPLLKEAKGKKQDPLLSVLNALCTLNAPSTSMICAFTGLPPWGVKRALYALKDNFGIKYAYDRSGNSADGGVGHYVLTDIGVFDRRKVVQYFLSENQSSKN